MESEYWVWLLQVMGSYNIRSHKLLEEYEDAKGVYRALAERGEECPYLSEAERRLIQKTPLEQSARVVEYCDKHHINIVTLQSPAYPDRLKSIFNPPILLFCMGDIGFIDDEVAITVVGTRNPSPYSLRVAKSICTGLAELGVVIVSGFALGIDSVAHGSALSLSERTVAVLGCGLDYDYPPKNTKLKRVIAKRGAVISEFLPGEKPHKANFPQRNRIMAGLSLGTLVIEAGKKSGSLITAELAIQHGRDLFCVPPADIFDERYAGVLKYLREGAIPTFSHLDIVYEYYENFSHKISTIHAGADKQDSLIYACPDEKSEQARKTVARAPIEQVVTVIPYDTLSEEQRKIVELISERSLLADEIAVLSQLPIDRVLSELTELELMELVTPISGQRFTIACPH